LEYLDIIKDLGGLGLLIWFLIHQNNENKKNLAEYQDKFEQLLEDYKLRLQDCNNKFIEDLRIVKELQLKLVELVKLLKQENRQNN
jgi:hypothetical protein